MTDLAQQLAEFVTLRGWIGIFVAVVFAIAFIALKLCQISSDVKGECCCSVGK